MTYRGDEVRECCGTTVNAYHADDCRALTITYRQPSRREREAEERVRRLARYLADRHYAECDHGCGYSADEDAQLRHVSRRQEVAQAVTVPARSVSWEDALAAQAGMSSEQLAIEHGKMAREWVVPPFSILDTTSGGWPDRKRAWLALGIESEIGRPDLQRGLDAFDPAKYGTPRSRAAKVVDGKLQGAGTSVFDPVLCELVYRWWCPAGGSVLDPFAGGSVRGIVAAMLGHEYVGVDLSAAQVAANRDQAVRILPADKPQPRWYVGDSREVVRDLPAGQLFDLVFSCPPYYDLEVYSDDERDLSNMATYADFLDAYQDIVAAACRRLRSDRFAVFVVSDVRDSQGFYVGLRRDTELAFERASHRLYNEAAQVHSLQPDAAQDVIRKWDEAKLVNSAGTLPLRAARAMHAGRKLGRMHQDVLVFTRTKPATHDWSKERQAPASPQTDLGLVQDAPQPVQQALMPVEPPVDVPPLLAPFSDGLADTDAGGLDHQPQVSPADMSTPAPTPELPWLTPAQLLAQMERCACPVVPDHDREACHFDGVCCGKAFA